MALHNYEAMSNKSRRAGAVRRARTLSGDDPVRVASEEEHRAPGAQLEVQSHAR
jgi:hypothetical protein